MQVGGGGGTVVEIRVKCAMFTSTANRKRYSKMLNDKEKKNVIFL